jgi:HD-like signal output (HDOD) protein
VASGNAVVDDSVLEAILRSGVTLPAPSRSLMQLQAALADDRSGPRELASVVARDPVLVGALTRIANSPAFYHQGSARSLVDVVARLGGTKTLAIAVSTTMRSAFSGVDQTIVDAVWERSAHVASRALHAARRSSQRQLADLAYFAALVHDAGICVLLRRTPGAAAGLRGLGAAEFDAGALAFDAATGAAHAAVSAIVARNWKLPPVINEAVRIHHQPPEALQPGDEAELVALLIAVGRRAVSGATDEWARWEPLAAAGLGLDPPMIEAMADQHAGGGAAR